MRLVRVLPTPTLVSVEPGNERGERGSRSRHCRTSSDREAVPCRADATQHLVVERDELGMLQNPPGLSAAGRSISSSRPRYRPAWRNSDATVDVPERCMPADRRSPSVPPCNRRRRRTARSGLHVPQLAVEAAGELRTTRREFRPRRGGRRSSPVPRRRHGSSTIDVRSMNVVRPPSAGRARRGSRSRCGCRQRRSAGPGSGSVHS